eukprot:UC1_evm1s1676
MSIAVNASDVGSKAMRQFSDAFAVQTGSSCGGGGGSSSSNSLSSFDLDGYLASIKDEIQSLIISEKSSGCNTTISMQLRDKDLCRPIARTLLGFPSKDAFAKRVDTARKELEHNRAKEFVQTYLSECEEFYTAVNASQGFLGPDKRLTPEDAVRKSLQSHPSEGILPFRRLACNSSKYQGKLKKLVAETGSPEAMAVYMETFEQEGGGIVSDTDCYIKITEECLCESSGMSGDVSDFKAKAKAAMNNEKCVAAARDLLGLCNYTTSSTTTTTRTTISTTSTTSGNISNVKDRTRATATAATTTTATSTTAAAAAATATATTTTTTTMATATAKNTLKPINDKEAGKAAEAACQAYLNQLYDGYTTLNHVYTNLYVLKNPKEKKIRNAVIISPACAAVRLCTEIDALVIGPRAAGSDLISDANTRAESSPTSGVDGRTIGVGGVGTNVLAGSCVDGALPEPEASSPERALLAVWEAKASIRPSTLIDFITKKGEAVCALLEDANSHILLPGGIKESFGSQQGKCHKTSGLNDSGNKKEVEKAGGVGGGVGGVGGGVVFGLYGARVISPRAAAIELCSIEANRECLKSAESALKAYNRARAAHFCNHDSRDSSSNALLGIVEIDAKNVIEQIDQVCRRLDELRAKKHLNVRVVCEEV